MKMTQEYLMYFKEFSCNQAENMQARCMPRFIQRFPNFHGKLTACSVSCAPFLRGEGARRERSGVGRHAAAQPPHGEARSASNALCSEGGVLRGGRGVGGIESRGGRRRGGEEGALRSKAADKPLQEGSAFGETVFFVQAADK